MAPTPISVVIAAYNRCAYLKAALDSLVCQDLPADSFEIIIVDNNSHDKTPELAASYCNRSEPVIRYVKELKQGLSFARNRGAQEARGSIVAFTDDDAVADKGWLQGLMGVYRQFPDAGVVGGKIKLTWPVEKPAWLSPNLEQSYGALDYGDEIQALRYPKTPFGGNFSVPRQLFLELGGFNEALGRTRARLLSSEEVYLCRLIEQRGKQVYYAPQAVVHHTVLPERMSKKYLLKRAYAQGKSNVMVEQKTGVRQHHAWRREMRDLAGTLKGSIRHIFVKETRLSAEDLFTLFFIAGKLKQRLRLYQK
jgi:glycosyltransferase involved in cell wall biosynthesis